MAASKEEQEVFNKLKARFPKVSNKGISQLMAIWQGEAPGFKTIKDEADPLYISPLKNKAGKVIGTGADRWANTFQTASKRNVKKFIKELLPDEINKLAKKYKLDPKGEQVKQLAEENLSTYSDKDWRELGSRWYQKQVNDRKAGILSKEQFKEKVFDVQYKDANVRGLGAFQVTGLSNIVKALQKTGRTELAAKVANDPAEIAKLRYDPEISWDITAGWIENNLLNADGDLKTTSFKELANKVNAGEEKTLPANRAKKATYYKDYLTKFDSPLPSAAEMQPEPEGMPSPYEQPMQFPSQAMSPLASLTESFIPSAQAQPAPQAQPTYDYIPQQPVPYTPSAPMSDFEQPQYATMEDLLADRGLMGTRGL
jgi:hypothetical protein